MNADSHIGEYIKQRLKQEGRLQSWLADKLGFTRQNITPTILEKSVLPIDRIVELEKILGRGFFADFYAQNPEVDPRYREPSDETQAHSSRIEIPQGSGFTLSFQIDPENFDPDKTPLLSKHLQRMLEDYQQDIKQLKK